MYTSIGTHNTGNDPKADELYKKATTELDPVKAEKYWNEFQVYVKTLYINIGIIEGDPLTVVGPSLGKFTGRNWVSVNDALNGIQHP
jgi:ABC-type transport system substrate-binding protein